MSLGKTMFEFENETNSGSKFTASQSKKKANEKSKPNMPSTIRHNQHTESLNSIFGQIWIRLRPTWRSLKYRYKVIFTPRNILQFIVLGGIGYYVVFADKGGSRVAGLDTTEGESIIEQVGSQPKAKKTKYKSKNDAAPVSGSELFAQEAATYIENFAPVARKEQAAFGVPASISLAQGLIESRAGTSKLAKGNNNHFGMKCFSRNCKKGHCSNFTDDTHKDFFRKYANPWDSWRDHSRMLSKGRYAKLKKHGSNYRQWAYGLKSIGYATDRTYAEKLIGVIERYDLHRFDN
jgi:flagellum-specific peptidoglycan hydrolase FlgJ